MFRLPPLPRWCLILLSFSLLTLLLSCQTPPPSQRIPAQIQRVVSGQTLEVLLQEQNTAQQIRIRLIGLSTPDLSQEPWGPQAQTTLAAWLQDSPTIDLEWDRQPQDPFGRYLAYVWKDGILINEQLLTQGYALLDTHAPNTKYQQRLEQAQRYARLMGNGIWNPQNPLRVTPQEARQQNKTPHRDP
ncbi:thermonuclease family protein [Spirulina subsalsa FACHB-351]|uniref:Thermonuclease family protein n=1 Tax=Spirulina subsalsa FACHB-351 TaxID=234711 RepID=A0ABT3L5C7_9CYAN|nr:thermonuclease family protein [Spirulina subsalsa]MCW6036690.1 thermonuclease family protein [Spirulina subsalsa FACHB-351]